MHCSYFLPWHQRFSCVLREFSVLAEGRPIFGHRLKPRAANPQEKTSRRERCYLPSQLTFELFIGLHLYANRLEVSNCNHMDRHVKKCPSTHIIHRKTSQSLKFIALREIMTESPPNSPQLMLCFSLSCNPFFKIWIIGSENDYP